MNTIDDKTPEADRQLYEQAVANRPDDNLLRACFAQYLEAMGNRTEAISECERVCELLPDLEWPRYYLGDLLARAGRYSEAAESFKRSLQIRSDFTQAKKALQQIQFNHPAAVGMRK